MDPVYTDVKGRSTRYCAFYLGQAQDVDTGGRFFYSPYLCISFDWWRLGGCRVAIHLSGAQLLCRRLDLFRQLLCLLEVRLLHGFYGRSEHELGVVVDLTLGLLEQLRIE